MVLPSSGEGQAKVATGGFIRGFVGGFGGFDCGFHLLVRRWVLAVDSPVALVVSTVGFVRGFVGGFQLWVS